MADPTEHEEEMTGETVALPQPAASKRPNACTRRTHVTQATQSRWPASKSSRKSTSVGARTFPGTYGLGAYITHPEAFGPERVLYATDDFVVINDLYPKSMVHCLILPRDPEKTGLHPFDAFEDPKFLSACKAESEKVKMLVASELRRRHGRLSKQDQARNEAMDSDDPPDSDSLPTGRDWTRDLITGIHAHPSMFNLHIHVLSPDRHSPWLKHRKHYNSFSTPFLVPLDAFPLAEDDGRRHPGRNGYMERDFVCWRCGRGFGKSMAALKAHLAEEAEGWTKE